MTHPNEVRAMSEAELADAVDNARREILNLRFQHARRQLSDTGRIRMVRRDLARLLTLQHERSRWPEYEAMEVEGEG